MRSLIPMLVLTGCASGANTVVSYEGDLRLENGTATLDCGYARKPHQHLEFEDLDDDGRWDKGEPATQRFYCPSASTEHDGNVDVDVPGTVVPSAFDVKLDRGDFLDRFTFEGDAPSNATITNAQGQVETVTAVSELTFYENVVIIRRRGSDEGRIVPVDRFVGASWK